MDKIDIKAFQDGNRLVVVFENATADFTKMITAFLGAAIEPAGNAKPVTSTDDIPVVLTENTSTKECEQPQDNETSDNVFTDSIQGKPIPTFKSGQYIGKTPWHCVDTKEPDAFNGYLYLMQIYKSGELNDDTDLKTACMDAIVKYLRCRFENTNAEEYAKALSENQCLKFFKNFEPAVSRKVKESIYSNKNCKKMEEFISQSAIEEKRAAVSEFIKFFQK